VLALASFFSRRPDALGAPIQTLVPRVFHVLLARGTPMRGRLCRILGSSSCMEPATIDRIRTDDTLVRRPAASALVCFPLSFTLSSIELDCTHHLVKKTRGGGCSLLPDFGSIALP
jgi:hypothetical protein